MAHIHTLSDDFNDNSFNTTKWTGSYGTVSESSQQISMTCTSGYSGFISNGNYDIRNSYMYTEVIGVPATGNGTTESYFQYKLDNDNILFFYLNNGTLTMRERTGGVNNDSTVTFSGTTHAWWRIREYDGTVYWDTSEDGETWTNRKTRTTPEWAGQGAVDISSGYYGSESSPGSFTIDNFNTGSTSYEHLRDEGLSYYYFDGSDAAAAVVSGSWTTITNADDGDINTSATTTSATSDMDMEGTNAPASGDTIQTVRYRVHGTSSSNQSTDYSVYTDGQGEGLDFYNPGNFTDTWTAWQDLSTPTGGWTWAKLQALEFYMSAADTGAGPHENTINRVEIEVVTDSDERFWVGGTANWDATAGTKWAYISGGTGGASVPTSTTDVFFDANSSGTATIAASYTANSRDFDARGFTGTLDMNDEDLLCYGSLWMGSGMTLTLGGDWDRIQFEATTTGHTITTNGKTLPALRFDGSGGGWTLQDSLTTNTFTVWDELWHERGTLDLNGQTIVTGSFRSINSNTRTLTTGAADITCSTFDLYGSNYTFNSDPSLTITASDIDCAEPLYAVTMRDLGVFQTGTRSLNCSSLNHETLTGDLEVRIRLSITVTGALTLNSAVYLIKVESTDAAIRVLNAGSVSLQNVAFRNISAGGTAIPFSGTRIGDLGGNSNITFSSSNTRYWVGGAGSWTNTSTGNWSTTSGGSSGASAPTVQDDVVFDANSGTGVVNISLLSPAQCRNLTATNSSAIELDATGDLLVTGDVSFGSNIDLDFTNNSIKFYGQTNTNYNSSADLLTDITLQTKKTSNSYGVLINTDISDASNYASLTGEIGTWDIQSDLTARLINTVAGTAPRIYFRTHTVTVKEGFSAGYNVFDGGTSTIIIDTGATVNDNEYFGPYEFYNLTLKTKSTGYTDIQSSSGFTVNGTFEIEAPNDVRFDDQETIALNGTLDWTGSSGNLITLTADTASNTWMLTSPNTQIADWLDLSWSDASSTASLYSSGTTTYSPQTLTGSATTVSLTDDSVSSAITVPFNFEFYGAVETTWYIDSNGRIMPANSGSQTNSTLPDDAGIYGWHDDLNPGAAGTVKYETFGVTPNRIFVVEFDSVQHYSSATDIYTFQIHLLESNNTIEIHTTTAETTSRFMTQGVTNGTQYTSYQDRNNTTLGSDITNEGIVFTPQTAVNKFYAGANSTNSGNNTGWNFTTPLIATQDSRFDNGATFYGPQLNMEATQNTRLDNNQTFYGGMGGELVEQITRFDNLFLDYFGLVAFGTTQPTRFDSTNTFYAGVIGNPIGPGPRLDNVNTFYAGTVVPQPAYSPQNVIAEPGNTFYPADVKGKYGAAEPNSTGEYEVIE